ncbi:hypothetical protein MferCBS31731_000998 [Microsporum ferrugineum]
MSYTNLSSTALQQSNGPGETLTLPILKFSYTTTSADRVAPLAWTHLSGGSDLLALFSTVRIRDEASKWTRESWLMKVMKGHEVLEELDLGLLAQRGSSMPMGDVKALVAVIVKSPCLAIRYPSGINQIRRFQVKFASVADYHHAIAVLKAAKCPITEPPATIAQPSSYTTSTAGSGYAGTDCRNVPPTPESIITPSCYYTDGLSTRPASSTFVETRPSSMESSMTLPSLPSARPSLGIAQSHFQKPSQTHAQAQADSNPRPSTAPTFLTSESLSQLLPPRRELPFAKKRPAERSPPGGPNPRKVNKVGQGRGGKHQACAATADSVARTAHTSVAGPSVQNSSHELVRGKESGKEQEPGCEVPGSLLLPPSISPQKRGGGEHRVENNTTTITDAPVVENISPRSTDLLPFTREDLSSYASHPTAERSDLIESWVCQQLQNDSFITLCQDMEGVWKRLAFGF